MGLDRAILSPFLFVLVPEALTRLIQCEEVRGLINGVQIERTAPPISHLLFADDIMLFCRANAGEARQVQKCLRIFGEWSGQVINPLKSYLIFSKNTPHATRDHLTNPLWVQSSSESRNYLGIPVLVPQSKTQACHAIQDKISSRLAGWKARALSQAGRTILLQSVISALPAYYMSIFMLPKRVYRSIDIRMKNFFWGFDGESRHFHPKSWESICKLKTYGGLGLRKMEDVNRALVAKMGWELAQGKDCLWVSALQAKYCQGAHFFNVPMRLGASWIWHSLLQTSDLVRAGFGWNVRDGSLLNI